MKRGSLIAFEGIDGAGKSTQLECLAAWLRERGHLVVSTAEPTAGPYGRRIREEARAGRRPAPERELEWFVADRREHVAAVVQPALDAGQVVLTDRYYLSTVAYQGARGLDPTALLREAEAEFPVPDLALLLWLPPEAGLRRVRVRDGAREAVFEAEEVLRGVAAVFASLDLPYLARIDASGEVAEVAARVRRTVEERLPALAVPASS